MQRDRNREIIRTTNHRDLETVDNLGWNGTLMICLNSVQVFSDVTSCNVVIGYQSSRGPY